MNQPHSTLQPPFHPAEDALLALMREGTLALEGLIPWSSNYTFLARIGEGPTPTPVVYKPIRGEQPLWDFPRGTLARRETASYLVSRALRWNLVPPTVLRRGPHGLGSVQLYVEVDQDAHYFTFQNESAYRDVLMAVALFDVIANNADRKAGHCLAIEPGRVLAIDQGLCFHVEGKLRTVIWDFAASLIPDLRRMQAELANDQDALTVNLTSLLSQAEIAALRRRLSQLLKSNRYPDPPEDRRPYPWPLV
ncbi:MAG: SCO1664 family protein [Anaerolineae bacterium]|nr:SCO1664 family protein [Anaerolineae bacterium]